MENKELKENTQKLFSAIIEGVESGELEAKIQAKCVCVDARPVEDEEVGKEHTVWSHGKVEKVVTLEKGMVLITTLDSNGEPVVDELGHENVYDMKAENFMKKYKKHSNGHFVQDGTPMLTVMLPEEFIPEEGITVLPPNWRGYSGTLMRGGLVMFPYNPLLSVEQNFVKMSKIGSENLDWYPNNETNTYAECNETGVFVDETLRKTFGQMTSGRK